MLFHMNYFFNYFTESRRNDIGVLIFTSDFDPDLYIGTPRYFLREFGKQPVEKCKFIM